MTLTQTKLSSEWFIGVSKDEKDQREKYIRNVQDVLEVFKVKIEKMEKEIYDDESSEASYDKDWQFLQAHRNGKKEALKTLKALVKHID